MTESSGETPREAVSTAANGTPAPASRHASHQQSAKALDTVVETVRRVMRADTASVAAFSLAARTITWKATSGFTRPPGKNDDREVVAPLRGTVAERAAASEGLMILEDIGVSDELSAEAFPLHSAEGVRTVALAPLRVRGETVGALLVGFRAPHRFTEDERETLTGLAEMAALALDNARLLETVSTAKKIWEQTFDAIPDGIIVHDADMSITRANAAAAEMMGLDAPSEAIGLSCAIAFARLFGERAAAYHMTNRTGAATSFEIQAEDSRRYLVAVAPLSSLESGVESLESKGESQAQEVVTRKASDIADTDSRPQTPDSKLSSWSVITWSDVTQLSEIQEQLARSRRLATVGQLAAGVAHEINNPLAAITTCAEATMRDIRTEPALAAAATTRGWDFYLEEIVRQALRCKLITRGLLDLARQRRARRESCDLNALISHTVKLFEERAVSQGVGAGAITFSLDLDESVGELATDESLIRQVLDNLLTNALDALGAAGGLVTVTTAAEGERVRVEVADTGLGIAPETLPRIFDPFFTTKEAGKGSGLGLAVATTVAEALGGALTVESKVGAGSCFRLWLPRRAPEVRSEA